MVINGGAAFMNIVFRQTVFQSVAPPRAEEETRRPLNGSEVEVWKTSNLIGLVPHSHQTAVKQVPFAWRNVTPCAAPSAILDSIQSTIAIK